MNLEELARTLTVDVSFAKRAATRMLGLDLESDLDRLGYVGRRCGWYPHRPPRVRGGDTRP